MHTPNKQLGQHWLHDAATLQAVVQAASVGSDDTVLEVGPGLGTLTSELVKQARQVVAVEFDPALAEALPTRVSAANLRVVHQDILQFNLTQLPKEYKVVANIPYYLTSKLVRLLLESPNPPSTMSLLVQKEVAQRMAAKPGDLSVLGVSVQFYTEPRLHQIVPAALFTPPPEVDSQIISLHRCQTPLFTDVTPKDFFRVVKAGFSEKRKKLRTSLSGGLRLSKERIDMLLKQAQIPAHARAQELRLEDWHQIALCLDSNINE